MTVEMCKGCVFFSADECIQGFLLQLVPRVHGVPAIIPYGNYWAQPWMYPLWE